MTQSSMLFPLYRDSIIDAHKVWWNLLLLLLDWYALPCWVVLNYVFIPYYLGHHIWMVPNFVNIFGHLLSFLPPPPFLRNGKSTPWCLVAGSHLQVRFFTQRRRTFLPLRHDFQIRRLLLQIGSGKQAAWKRELQGRSKSQQTCCKISSGPSKFGQKTMKILHQTCKLVLCTIICGCTTPQCPNILCHSTAHQKKTLSTNIEKI